MESQQNKCARVVTGCLAVANSEAVLACADLPPLRYVAQERGTLLREHLLRLEPEAPAHEIDIRQKRPRLKSRSHESWKRGHEKTDSRRPYRGCWRRMATEFQCTKSLDSTERETCLCEYPPWEDANLLVEFHLDLAEKYLKRLS